MAHYVLSDHVLRVRVLTVRGLSVRGLTVRGLSVRVVPRIVPRRGGTLNARRDCGGGGGLLLLPHGEQLRPPRRLEGVESGACRGADAIAAEGTRGVYWGHVVFT